jgi:hypothetical protein
MILSYKNYLALIINQSHTAFSLHAQHRRSLFFHVSFFSLHHTPLAGIHQRRLKTKQNIQCVGTV